MKAKSIWNLITELKGMQQYNTLNTFLEQHQHLKTVKKMATQKGI